MLGLFDGELVGLVGVGLIGVVEMGLAGEVSPLDGDAEVWEDGLAVEGELETLEGDSNGTAVGFDVGE